MSYRCFTKYALVKLFKNKKGKTLLNAFIEIVNKFNRKTNKLRVDQGEKFYNNLILMYSAHIEGNSVIAERFIKTLKAKTYKKVTANDKKSYLPYLNKLVDQYNNTYYHSIHKKPINIDYSALTKNIEMNPKAPKFKVNYRRRITNYKNIFSKGYIENWSREIFIIDSVFKSNPWTLTTLKIKDLNGEKIIGSFHEKELLRSIL